MRKIHKHGLARYPISLAQRLYSLFGTPIIVALILFVIAHVVSTTQYVSLGNVPLETLLLACAATLGRMVAAFALALLVSIPLSLLGTASRRLEFIFLPMFDIIESVPILAFFPVIILFFIHIDYLNGAALVILFMNMVWNIVFTSVSGLKAIPTDIRNVARIFGLKPLARFRRVILPAIFPHLVTGSILAFAQGWNITMVAEALHVYAPLDGGSRDLFGIGSIMVQSAAAGQTDIFLAAMFVMIGTIALLNFLVWQKLLHYAQRYRFE